MIPSYSFQLWGHEEVTEDLNFNFLIFKIKKQYFIKHFSQESYRVFQQIWIVLQVRYKWKIYFISSEGFFRLVLTELLCLIAKLNFILAFYGKGISSFLEKKADTFWNL